MNGKRISALAFVAALAATVEPTFAAPTGSITVEWDTQTVATVTLTTQYNGTPLGTHLTTAETIYPNLNGGAGLCQASDTEATTGTVNFGNVTPDTAQYTDCLEVNAVNAMVESNDPNGYKVSESAASAPVGVLICELPNGTWANNLAVTASARTAAPSIASTTTCGAGNWNLATTTAQTLISTAAPTPATNLGGDIELVLEPNAPASGATQQTDVITYTVTSN